MYDRPELRAAHAAFWDQIRSELGYGPDDLSTPTDLPAFWRAPDLVLGQTCGLPFRSYLWPDVAYVCTPDYGLPDCPSGYYNSVILVHSNAPLHAITDLTDRTFAYNEPLSQSGWAGPITYLNTQGIRLGAGHMTGAHLNSIAAVIDGTADVCAIDAQTYRLFRRYDARADLVREIGRTTPTPALPMICSPHYDPTPIAAALCNGLTKLTSQHRQDLGIERYVTFNVTTYRNVNTPPSPDEAFDKN